MKDSKVIVAIDKDSEAPTSRVAAYSLEADLASAVPKLVNAHCVPDASIIEPETP
jgi:electron transfer flavoprotein alpha subunit